MRKLDIKTGDRYNRLTIIEEVESRGKIRIRFFKCKCDCGNHTIVSLRNLRRGITKSCGCYNIESLKKNKTKHSHTINKIMSSEYISWCSMKQRCYNPNRKNYKNYGGRGITICDEWLNSFENFYKDMGKRPEGTTIDRINPNGNYEPSNCRWSTKKEQNMNRRNVRHKSN